MRRNVRRLNREVGGVVVAISGGKATATTKNKVDTDTNGVKKAANLSELKRYCKAAEEAAREVRIHSVILLFFLSFLVVMSLSTPPLSLLSLYCPLPAFSDTTFL
jgi:hypothetical protein